MLRSLKDLERYTVSAADGDIGNVVNFLLDDQHWIVRYLIVEINDLPVNRRVLISPISFYQVEWSTLRFHVTLTMDKVRNSPSVDVDRPVSRQHELEYFNYYEYPAYWGQSGLWGMDAPPGLVAAGGSIEPPTEDELSDKPGDVHLHSAKEVRGYYIQGSDETIGHIEDFIIDDETWEIRYLVIDTSNWWFGKKVLVAPPWASRISWQESKVHINMSREEIKNSPEWDPTAAINREYESRLYDYYGRPVYWTGDDPTAAASAPHHEGTHPK